VPASTTCYWIKQGYLSVARSETRNGKEVQLVSRLGFQLHLFEETAGTHRRAPELVDISKIVLDRSYQLRTQTNPETVQKYAADIRAGKKLPPVLLAQIDGQLVVPDGHHRTAGHIVAGHTQILARILSICTRAEVMFLAALANQENALQLTKADRRKIASVLILSPEGAQLTCAELADMTGYVAMTISRLRRKLLRGEEVRPKAPHQDASTEAFIVAEISKLTKRLRTTQPVAAEQIEGALKGISSTTK
jgi:ParB-like chromosome segregation protein Spo0J